MGRQFGYIKMVNIITRVQYHKAYSHIVGAAVTTPHAYKYMNSLYTSAAQRFQTP